MPHRKFLILIQEKGYFIEFKGLNTFFPPKNRISFTVFLKLHLNVFLLQDNVLNIEECLILSLYFIYIIMFQPFLYPQERIETAFNCIDIFKIKLLATNLLLQKKQITHTHTHMHLSIILLVNNSYHASSTYSIPGT